MAVILNFDAKEYEKIWPQILAIVIGGLAGFSNGLLFSWSSPFLIKITQDKVNYDITEHEASYFNTIQPIALMIACPIFSKLSDIIGRKRTLLLIVIPQIGSWLCAALGRTVYTFYVSRMFSGIADGCLYATLPTYIGEVANPTVRGIWGNAVALSIISGEFMINVLGSYLGVTTTSWACLPIPVLFFVLFWFMPESPYTYIMKGKEEEAKNSLRFLKRIKNVDEIFENCKYAVERQLSESGTWIDLFKEKSNRKALFAGIFLRLSQQMAGDSVFLTYTQFIFQKSGNNMSHEEASIVFMGLAVTLNLLSVIFVINRFGRIFCYTVSMVTTSGVLFAMGAYFYIDGNTNIDLSSVNWIPLACMMSYLLFASIGIAVIPTLMLGELLSASIKSKALTILLITYGVGNFLTSTIFYQLNTLLGFYAPFLLFAMSNAVCAVTSRYIIPETKGKSLEEIQQILKGNLKN
ncbi:facilitated trehalose transporter Tret1-like [Diabrotica virgifera virgifera]|uniref:Major facilitator superfamily (MFS) profile domain-containing protein n=1 Tax=Diabrotica virgifera virgifera TaxID=50390 RepID=A0ABM5JJV4_DIAVI|nr:facilitated trehalose transporter Tret1-like [Diabrotica virgifera virgifera]